MRGSMGVAGEERGGGRRMNGKKEEEGRDI